MGYANLILSGGRVFRGLYEGFAEAVAIHGDRIVAAGSRDAVEALAIYGAFAAPFHSPRMAGGAGAR